MLAATRQLDLISIALFTLVLAISWNIDTGRLVWKLSPAAVSWIMLIFLPFPFIDWLAFGTPPIVALVHFIFFASSMKLLQQKRNRDWLWLYVVSFFQMLLAAGMMIDTTFFLLLLVFLFSAVSTLVSFEMRRAGDTVTDNDGETREFWRETASTHQWLGQPRWHSIAVFSGLSLIVILVLATPLFLAMPRLALRNSGAGWMQGTSLSGFSETVRLGDVGTLKLNPRLVMRVRVVQPPDQYRSPLRWRGITLDNYDGTTWRDSLTLRRGTRTDSRPVTRSGNAFWVDEKSAANHVAMAQHTTHQAFYLEPLSTPTVFAAPRAIWIEGLPSLWKDSGDGLWTSNHAMNRITYSVESDARQPTDRELREADPGDYDQGVMARYTQLPASLDPRIGRLAAELAGRNATAIDVARVFEQHLRTAYSYSLDLRRTGEKDPVADFLFNVKAGHCEYFATAMTLMLRSQGIPARLVNGFQMGEYSDVSDFYTVRQSDAHSWVEAYFGKFGWVAFDPTPAAGLSQYDSGWTTVIRHYTEAAEMFWLEHVIGFGSSEQAVLAFRAQRVFSDYQNDSAAGWERFKIRMAGSIRALRERLPSNRAGEIDLVRTLLLNPVTIAFGLTGLVLIGYVLWRRREMTWKRVARHSSAGSAVAFYQQMLETLAREGTVRNADQTPREFADSLALEPVTDLTNIYERLRFGGGTLTPAEISRIELQLRRLRKSSD